MAVFSDGGSQMARHVGSLTELRAALRGPLARTQAPQLHNCKELNSTCTLRELGCCLMFSLQMRMQPTDTVISTL